MSDTKNRLITIKAKTDFAGAALILGVFAVVILFIGEPDLHDAWIERWSQGPATVAVEAPASEPEAAVEVATE